MNWEKKINQGEREEILEVVSPHPLVYWPRYILAAFILFPTIFFASWLLTHPGWGSAVFIVGLVLSINLVLKAWFFSTYNGLVVTSERLVDVDRPGWFAESIMTLPLSRIKEIRIVKKGFFNTVCNLADIIITPHDDDGEFEIRHVKAAQQVERLIWEAAGSFVPVSGEEIVDGISAADMPQNETELLGLEESLRKLSRSDLLLLQEWLTDRLKTIKH